jgi:hypothetical protein
MRTGNFLRTRDPGENEGWWIAYELINCNTDLYARTPRKCVEERLSTFHPTGRTVNDMFLADCSGTIPDEAWLTR